MGRTAWLLVGAHAPAAIVSFQAFVLVTGSDPGASDPFLVFFLYVPAVLQVPATVGTVRHAAGRGGSRWLLAGGILCVAYALLLGMGGGEGILVGIPFLAAGACALAASRRLAPSKPSGLPTLPDTPD